MIARGNATMDQRIAEPEELDAVVLGGSIRGLVTCYLLQQLGCRAVLIEAAPRIGGVDASFAAADGTLFDHGLHVLDFMRSGVATRLFTHVVAGAVHKVKLQRGVVLRGHVVPYAFGRDDLPDELRALLPEGELIDDVGDAPPTRDRLARCYGRAFADLIFDEVLPSFPSECRHRELGVDESLLLANVYPWFFPRARRAAKRGDESRSFHDQLRRGIDQYVLYPARGGFGGFVDGFARALDPGRVEVIVGASDLRVELEPGSHRVRGVAACGRRFHAPHYFWCASWPRLCSLLALPCQEVATDRVLLGSFRFDRPARTHYHELLVGDPRIAINRVHFPAAFRRSDEALVQIEYAFPAAESRPDDAATWLHIWLEGLRGLGLIDARHRVELYDFKSLRMHFNSFGMEGVALRDADPALLHADSNLRPVVPSMANLNLNTHVPRTLRYVTAVLAGATPAAEV